MIVMPRYESPYKQMPFPKYTRERHIAISHIASRSQLSKLLEQLFFL